MLVVDLIDRADIGMVQRRCSLGFALEASQRLWVFGDIVRQKLKCDEATQLHVLGFVNDTHPAAAQLLDDLVMRDGLPNKLGGRGHWRKWYELAG